MHIFHVVMRRVLRFIPCAAFILSWADVAVKYILSYTICFVGIYGLNFSEGAVNVKSDSGFWSCISHELVSSVCYDGCTEN